MGDEPSSRLSHRAWDQRGQAGAARAEAGEVSIDIHGGCVVVSVERKKTARTRGLIWDQEYSREIKSAKNVEMKPCSAGGFSRNLPATTVFFSHAKSASYSAKQYFPLTRNQPASQPASQPNKAHVSCDFLLPTSFQKRFSFTNSARA